MSLLKGINLIYIIIVLLNTSLINSQNPKKTKLISISEVKCSEETGFLTFIGNFENSNGEELNFDLIDKQIPDYQNYRYQAVCTNKNNNRLLESENKNKNRKLEGEKKYNCFIYKKLRSRSKKLSISTEIIDRAEGLKLKITKSCNSEGKNLVKEEVLKKLFIVDYGNLRKNGDRPTLDIKFFSEEKINKYQIIGIKTRIFGKDKQATQYDGKDLVLSCFVKNSTEKGFIDSTCEYLTSFKGFSIGDIEMEILHDNIPSILGCKKKKLLFDTNKNVDEDINNKIPVFEISEKEPIVSENKEIIIKGKFITKSELSSDSIKIKIMINKVKKEAALKYKQSKEGFLLTLEKEIDIKKDEIIILSQFGTTKGDEKILLIKNSALINFKEGKDDENEENPGLKKESKKDEKNTDLKEDEKKHEKNYDSKSKKGGEKEIPGNQGFLSKLFSTKKIFIGIFIIIILIVGYYLIKYFIRKFIGGDSYSSATFGSSSEETSTF